MHIHSPQHSPDPPIPQVNNRGPVDQVLADPEGSEFGIVHDTWA
ncbi:hypothetical protein ACRYGZ_24610 [Mycobacteroides abscessus]|uniref:Uncharacterized protein n=1 Tax=Mycobacteroides abscessus 1948 TaxID=1299323 RepID=A0A829QKF3_9MYCO|nr:hypothetical protein [Mycobacteroides abscessus]EIU37625.1 hypothetical protein MA6G0125S_5076 [Mycobacteroides abscessus 6G-0125-S]EIU52533.1 hypothetical protein MA6G1108_5005 [Mycobacteroides abscessus 6G-1108]EIU54538.1 hypothetical protein MA6G0728S_4767 [Mycobacteroides abscessus 6G-0728-S]EIU90098.1 hypothetical protein MA6G0212_5062 [Mycobacteroides abscessus 6G-0212]EIV21942.1 hypothetical protein MA3A0122R_5273 [Mycobacteroides abscessus 3A-0122-R]EIV32088.1 hypothetical protein 